MKINKEDSVIKDDEGDIIEFSYTYSSIYHKHSQLMIS